MIPSPILRQLREEHHLHITDYSSVIGGCINTCYRINTSVTPLFLKWNNPHRYPGMFAAEAKGLRLLAENSLFTIPKVLFTGETENYSWLVMEFIESGVTSQKYWAQLGEKLALMHQTTRPMFGLEHNNYIGSLPQMNSPMSNWCEFFISQRIIPQLKLAIDENKLEGSIFTKFEKLFNTLPAIFPKEPPALLHGDLWSGNLQPSANGCPCLFDPAVYYGSREMELAYTQLFGGFDAHFYDTYHHTFPLAPEFQSRVSLYNLYPLLVHVNLFGGSYINQVKQIVDNFS